MAEAMNDAKQKVNILLVDDQADGLVTLEAVLERLGQNLVTARSGREALRHLLATDFAVVLLDVQMPEMDGFETASLIRERERSRLTPIIFLTAALQSEVHQIRGYEVGAVDYLFKPVQPEILISKVSVFVELAQHRELVRRQAEAESANRMKDEFLATLSHELRTPLNAILGWAQMLRSGALDGADAQRALEAIERNAKLQNELIKDVLDVSRIISGKLEIDMRPVNLVPLIEAAVDTVRPTAAEKKVRLKLKLDPTAGHVAGDPARLQQIVWNLVANAVKFTHSGGRVHIELERTGSRVVITVADNGRGIAPDFLPHVFDRFRQADSSSTRLHGGLGLGLAIVRHLVDMHGGTVTASSPGEGMGATFKVRLPVLSVAIADDEPHDAGGDQLKQDLDSLPLRGVQIVVVDDDKDARELLTHVLTRSGAVPTAVATVCEALDAVQRLRPDIVISDVEMPKEDGYSLIARLRALPPGRGGDTPAAALTAYARPEDRLKLLKAGFESHIVKPVQPMELVAVVASLVRRAGRGETVSDG